MNKQLRLTLSLALVTAAPLSAEEVYELKDFTVSAGPVARPVEDFASPFSSLDEEEIQNSNAGTLGDLLNGQPGVTASSFGGGASRPIIRGFDGPRVRIVESGLGSLDVSDTSPDHAVTIEPLLTQRVEVLRGPSTLLYGSSAIGGVVNTVSRDLPREKPDRMISGGIEARHDTVSDGETFLGYSTFSNGPLVVTIQGLTRKNDDYEIPSDAEAFEEEHADDDDDDDDHHEEGGDTLASSFVDTDFKSIGASWFFTEQNYFGVSVSAYDAFYGIPGHAHEEEHADDDDDDDDDHEEEEGIVLDAERLRFDAELAIVDPIQWIEALRVRFGYTDYEHQELEEEGPAATFERDGWELRAEAAHHNWAIFNEGIVGVQISDTDFQAIGEEIESDDGFAFGPPSTTRNQAIFISEHIHGDEWHFDLGGRIERQTIDVSEGDDYSDVATSIALGTIWNIDEENSLGITLQRTQRHPTATELYANGPHFATSQFERGDDSLDMETAYGADISFRHNSRDWSAKLSVFYTYFEDYIFSQNTGLEDGDTELPIFDYIAVDAIFYGAELEVDYLVFSDNIGTLYLSFLADYIRAENEDDGTDLPRIPPFRIGGKAKYAFQNWSAGILLRHSFDQNDTAPLETDTDDYTELEAEIAYRHIINDRSSVTFFARGSNLFDEEIRHHTSAIKDEAPRPGRSLTIGARYEF